MTQTGPHPNPTAPPQRIVVGYVRVRACRAAMENALQLARQSPSTTVYIVRAIPVEHHVELSELDAVFERARDETTAAVVEACQRIGAPSLPVHIDVSFGDPAKTIAAAAKRVAATLVIIGHGSQGSVAKALARRLRCPLHVATADRYSIPPELQLPQETGTPDDANRQAHNYRLDDVLEHATYRIGPSRIC